MSTYDDFAEFLRERVFRFIGQSGAGGALPSQATQGRFARIIEIDKGTLSRLLHGRNIPSPDTLRKLVQAEEVGASALAALGYIPDDHRVTWLLDQVIQGKITPAELERMVSVARELAPDDDAPGAPAQP